MLAVNRSNVYYKAEERSKKKDMVITTKIQEIYEKHPFYGYRKIHIELKRMGHQHNRKKTQRLMQKLNMKAIYPEKRTTFKGLKKYVHPYLLTDMDITRSNQVWATDITYIKLDAGFCYLAAIIDVYSRRIMGYKISPFLDTKLCIDALDMGLENDNPEIINSDQGCQFTSGTWINKLKENKINLSMDGKGRCFDNIFIERFWRSVKYELVYLYGFENITEACNAISNYISFYNEKRPHQSLGYKTPNEVHFANINENKGFLNTFMFIRKEELGIPKQDNFLV